MEKLRIALDWTANTNHTGFYVAKAKGFYDDLGLEVEIVTPDADNYAITPAKKVELGVVDFALCPFESVISYRTKTKPFNGVAIAALLREDLSAIACLEDSGIRSPRDLDGKTYASYKARYEDEIVKQMIKNDGGAGNIEVIYPEKLGIWNTILDRTSDATWIFSNWEGIQAKNEGVALKTFRMKDYGIPYGYSPVLFADALKIKEKTEVYRDFLTATKNGYLHARANPEEAIQNLSPHISEGDKNIDLLESQKYTAQFYGDEINWGKMESDKVEKYMKWLANMGLERQALSANDLCSTLFLN